MRIGRKLGGVAVAMGLSVAVVYAHGGATGIVKQRMDAMENIGDHMKLIGEMLRGNSPYDTQKIAASAQMIGKASGKELTVLFPEDSLMHPTEASPDIWSNWEKFSQYSDELRQAAEGVVAAADEGAEKEVVASEFGRLARTCKSCHEQFRTKK